MNEIITFFRNFEQDQGITCRLTVELPGNVYSLLIYLKSSCSKPELFSDQKFNDMESYRAYKLKIIESIGQSDGGLVVEVKDENKQLGIKIQGVSAAEPEAGLPPPRHIFYLEPSYRLAERPFNGTELDLKLSKDSHLILPVDENAEAHFKSFRENYSTWFPADFEPTMLNLLRQPTLDLRVARLEEKLEEKASEKAAPVAVTSKNVEISRQDNQPPLRKKLVSTDTILPAITALILVGILAAGIHGYKSLRNDIDNLGKNINELLVFSKSPKEKTIAVVQVAPDQAPSTSSQKQEPQEQLSQGQTTEPSQSTENLPGAINGLLLFLSKQRDNNPAINLLWNVHFNKIENIGNLDQNMIIDLFKRKEFLWGMIKLPTVITLITNDNIKDTRFLENIDAITLTGDVYNLIFDPKHQNSIRADNEVRTMLAYLTCQVQEIESDPKLKTAIKNNFFKQSTNIFKAEPCINLQRDDALPGIVKLKSELEKILPVSTQAQQK